jgi:hypothetical protein
MIEVGLFQDVMTQVGKKYKLTFAYGPREQKRADGDNLLGVAFGNLKANLDAGTSKSGWKMFSGTTAFFILVRHSNSNERTNS